MTSTPPTSTPPTPVTAAPPAPSHAVDAAAFVAELRRLRTWSGRSFRQLERRAAAAGDLLPASTAATMLGRDRLPREELLVTFVRACGLDEDDVRRWASARATLADGGGTAAAAPAPATPPRPRAATRWRPAVAVLAALAVAWAGGAAFAAGTRGATDEQETVSSTP